MAMKCSSLYFSIQGSLFFSQVPQWSFWNPSCGSIVRCVSQLNFSTLVLAARLFSALHIPKPLLGDSRLSIGLILSVRLGIRLWRLSTPLTDLTVKTAYLSFPFSVSHSLLVIVPGDYLPGNAFPLAFPSFFYLVCSSTTPFFVMYTRQIPPYSHLVVFGSIVPLTDDSLFLPRTLLFSS